jgi:hypothetical protein
MLVVGLYVVSHSDCPSIAGIVESPFDRFDFNRRLLSRDEIKRRQETRFANPMDREIIIRTSGRSTALQSTLTDHVMSAVSWRRWLKRSFK